MQAIDALHHEIGPIETGRILLVSSNDVDLNVLSRLLEDEGYEVKTASTGVEAIYHYEIIRPNLVLMDVVLDEMDGYDAANKITELSGDSFIPIIFMSTLDTADVMVKSLKNGGVDLLVKPYNQTTLRSKVETFISLSNLYRSNEKQRGELEYHNQELTSNYEVASNVFDKVIYSDVLDTSAIKYSISPLAIFNGDIILAAFRPSGELQVLLGDFTGHGISAAIGAIPVSEIFYGMTAKGFGISEILSEINSKIQRVLPRGLFLTACTFEYNPDLKKLSIWNAGIPDALIYDSDKSEVVQRFSSKNFPLGVSDEISVTNMMDHYVVQNNQRILLFTDGIIEARNRDDELYGIERVVDELKDCKSHWILDKLLMNLDKFSEKTLQSDDTTVFELKFDKVDKPVDAKKESALPAPVKDSNWQLDFTFGATILKLTDPLPTLIQMVMDMQRLQKHKQDIFIIIKELFVNALDHGVLELDSKLKQSPEGFSRYVVERQQKLETLVDGEITVSLKHTGDSRGGCLDVTISDSGAGFDSNLIISQSQNMTAHHGRGIFMVNTICESLKYNKKGNRVEARYLWSI